jgi:hypothetical protein
MNCDYYLDKQLHIFDYQDNKITYIQVKREKIEYENDMDTYPQKFGMKLKPTLVYVNSTWVKPTLERKYRKTVDYNLWLFNKTWKDVNKIMKIETISNKDTQYIL